MSLLEATLARRSCASSSVSPSGFEPSAECNCVGERLQNSVAILNQASADSAPSRRDAAFQISTATMMRPPAANARIQSSRFNGVTLKISRVQGFKIIATCRAVDPATAQTSGLLVQNPSVKSDSRSLRQLKA